MKEIKIMRNLAIPKETGLETRKTGQSEAYGRAVKLEVKTWNTTQRFLTNLGRNSLKK